MTSTKAKLEFVYAMAKHSSATVRQCLALMRYAATLQRIAESECNDNLDDFGMKRRDKKKASMRSRVIDLCTELRRDGDAAPAPVFSSDPRGAVLKIRVADGFTNDFAGEGICVPS
jgi:hypothetical protein